MCKRGFLEHTGDTVPARAVAQWGRGERKRRALPIESSASLLGVRCWFPSLLFACSYLAGCWHSRPICYKAEQRMKKSTQASEIKASKSSVHISYPHAFGDFKEYMLVIEPFEIPCQKAVTLPEKASSFLCFIHSSFSIACLYFSPTFFKPLPTPLFSPPSIFSYPPPFCSISLCPCLPSWGLHGDLGRAGSENLAVRGDIHCGFQSLLKHQTARLVLPIREMLPFLPPGPSFVTLRGKGLREEPVLGL